MVRKLPSVQELQSAIRANDLDRVRHLLGAGADPGKPDVNGEDALVYAIRRGAKMAVLRVLAASGADPRRLNKGGQSPLMIASQQGRVRAVTVLSMLQVPLNHANRSFETALTYAVTWRRTRVVKKLLALGASPDNPPSPAWSPLMYAAQVDNVRLSKLLVAAGATLERTDEGGRTAAVIARSRGHEALARMLSPRTKWRDVRTRHLRHRPSTRTR